MKILYVEDNPLDVELTTRELARGIPALDLAVRTTVAAGAAELEAQADYDAVLTDLRLPDGSGLDIVNLVRARRLASAVVVLTGQGDEEIAVAAIKAGADDYVAKREGYSRRLPQLVLAAVDRFHVESTRKAGRLRVLYAEHNQADIELTRRHLAQRAPHIHVDTVYSAAEVLARLPADPVGGDLYDVVLLDFGLPDGNAIELLKVMRDERHLDIPVVLVTGQGDEEIAAQVLRLGAADYIVKHGGYLFEVPVALENAHAQAGLTRERAALERRLAEMDAVYHVAHALLTAQTQAEAVDILLNQAMAALRTDAAAVWLLDGTHNMLQTAATSGWCASCRSTQVAHDRSSAGSMLGSALDSVVPRVERNIRALPNLSEPLATCAPSGWGGCWVPIRTPRASVGVLFVSVPLPRTIGGEQARLLLSLAEMAGSMIERLRLLDEARVQVTLTQQIVNTVPEGLALVSSDGEVLLVNPAAEQFLIKLGPAAAENQPGTIVRLGPWPLAEILVPGRGWREFEQQGRTYTLSCSQVEPTDPGSAWVLVLADLTGQRVQQRYQEIQERLATVGQLAAGIAHDFNNVLGVITVYADILLAAPNLDVKQQSQLATVFDQAQHAANLVRQILDFSRRAVMERSRLDLFPLLNEQVKLLRRTLPENIELQLQADQVQLPVDADPTRLRQVLMNLAINARDAMPDGGRLSFHASTIDVGPDRSQAPLPDIAPGAWLCLVAEDPGTGIAAEHLPHIFEPFFTTKAPGAGTGLGLAQVYGIVKQHGGAIDVSSTPGQGTRFRLYLPLAAGTGEQESPPLAAPLGKGEWILLVEDNPELRAAVGDSLEGQGYRVLAAPHAAAALAAAGSAGHTFDLVLTDLVMPGINGVEMFTSLRSQHPCAKLIVMTGHPLTEARMAVLDSIGSWIQKPFALNSLLRKVRLLLDAPQLPTCV